MIRTIHKAGLAVLAAMAFALMAVNTASGAIGIDQAVSKDQATSSKTIATAVFSTKSSNELLLAFVSADAPSSGTNTTVQSIATTGIAWVLVRRTNTQLGTAEIWRAFATSLLTNATVTATLSRSTVSSMTVMSFTGVDTTGAVGATGTGSSRAGAPTASLVTTRANSLVIGVGNDWDNAIGRAYDQTSQTLVHQYFPPTGDTYWVQRQISTTPASGTRVTINDTAPTGDRYNLSIVEVLASSNQSPTPDLTLTKGHSGNFVQGQTGATYTITVTNSGSSATTGTVTMTDTLPASFTPTAISGTNWTCTLSPLACTRSDSLAAAASYPAISVTVNVASNAPGSVTNTATVSGGGETNTSNDTANDVTTIIIAVGPPASVRATAGTPQSTATNTTFSTRLQATVKDANNNPVGGVTVTFTPPSSGASGTFAGGVNTAVTNSSGVATAATFTANGVVGGPYNVTATVPGLPAANFALTNTSGPPLLYPDLQDILPTGKMSVVKTATGRQFQYTHDTLNGGPGPWVIQPVYNAASGSYQGTQYIYSQNSSGVWSLAKQIPVAGAFFFDSDHGHFHFPLVTYGLYTVAANGGPGTPVAVSAKVAFCINDSFLYEKSIPNAGALGNLGPCTDPTSLRGLNIGAVDEYDQTDEGQSIEIDGLPDGTYWLRAIVDPNNFVPEANKTNNETDVEFTITGTSLQVLQTVVPVINAPPDITLTTPANGATVSGTIPLNASSLTTSGAQFLVDGEYLANVVPTGPYSASWDTTTVPNGKHWIAAQTTDSTGVIGTSAVAIVTVSNNASPLTTVRVTSPAAGSILSATVSLYATVATSQTIAGVAFYVDSTQVGTSVASTPYMISWDTTTVSLGQHVLTASATDTQGNTVFSVPITITVDNSHPANVIGQDVTVSADGQNEITTPLFSTAGPGELLVAFVSYDGPSTSAQTANVSGAGLSWTLLERSNTEAGTSEIWSARAAIRLPGTDVLSVPGIGGFHGSLTVIAFTNAAGTSVVSRTGALTGAPDIYLPGVIAGDWAFAVGNDWDRAVARTPVSGQVLVHQYVDSSSADTYWVQSTSAPATANSLVDIHDSAPTNDRWNYAAVEIVATHQ